MPSAWLWSWNETVSARTRCEAAAEGISADVIDLRTLNPWDRDAVLDSVRRTRRCLIVHEDLRTGGFGAEIAAVVADDAFLDLDAPVARVTMPDIPSPHHPSLLAAVTPEPAIPSRIKLTPRQPLPKPRVIGRARLGSVAQHAVVLADKRLAVIAQHGLRVPVGG